MIPKIIYMFWHDGKPPSRIQKMVTLAKQLNPTWKFRLLTEKTKCPKPDGYESLEVEHKSDWYRIYFMERTGGVWMDIWCIHIHPIESWVDLTSDNIQGFQWPYLTKVMENWAFAAPPKHPFVTEWKQEFAKAINMGFKKYKRSLSKELLGKDLHESLPYLSQHAAWRVVHARRKSKKEVTMSSSANVQTGPSGLIVAADWDHVVFARRLTSAPKKRYKKMPFIKLRGIDREEFFSYLDEREQIPCGYIPTLLNLKQCGVCATNKSAREKRRCIA